METDHRANSAENKNTFTDDERFRIKLQEFLQEAENLEKRINVSRYERMWRKLTGRYH